MDLLAQVPYFPPPDGNVVAKALTRAPGGVGANIAVGLARLGHNVKLLGAVGDDDTGSFLREQLKAQGVNTSSMLIRKGVLTYSCFIAVRPEGERAIYGLPGAAILETTQELDRQAIREAQALHIAPSHRDVALTAIEEARRGGSGGSGRSGGSFISYTPADIRWPENPNTVREIARQVDLLIVNRVEAADLTGLHKPEQAIRQLVAWGYDPVALTVGADGVWIGNGGHVEHIPALPRSGIRDTTGAGDAFAAGIVTGKLMGHALKQATRLGIRVASLKLRESGAQAGLPSLEEALALL